MTPEAEPGDWFAGRAPDGTVGREDGEARWTGIKCGDIAPATAQWRHARRAEDWCGGVARSNSRRAACDPEGVTVDFLVLLFVIAVLVAGGSVLVTAGSALLSLLRAIGSWLGLARNKPASNAWLIERDSRFDEWEYEDLRVRQWERDDEYCDFLRDISTVLRGLPERSSARGRGPSRTTADNVFGARTNPTLYTLWRMCKRRGVPLGQIVSAAEARRS